MKRFLDEGRMEEEKERVQLSIGEEQIAGAQTFRNKNEEKLFGEMLTLT